jgi:hypothetical protein
VERGGGDGEDTADAEGGRRGLALEGFIEGEEKVVGVDFVCARAESWDQLVLVCVYVVAGKDRPSIDAIG